MFFINRKAYQSSTIWVTKLKKKHHPENSYSEYSLETSLSIKVQSLLFQPENNKKWFETFY